MKIAMKHACAGYLLWTPCAALLALSAAPALAADSLPQWTIAYFNGACPEGWQSFDGAKGHFLVPSTEGGGSGASQGVALASGEEPRHAHRSTTGLVSTSSKEFILISGCCNENLAKADTYSMSGSTDEAAAGVPYIQYLACMKQGADKEGSVPRGVIVFNLFPLCPAGWSEMYSAKGRYPVGLPANGAPGATFGGPPLKAGEYRTHSHSMDGTIDLPGHSIVGGSGCCARDYAGSGKTAFYGHTVPDPDADHPYDSAVRAPYYTATFCQKN